MRLCFSSTGKQNLGSRTSQNVTESMHQWQVCELCLLLVWYGHDSVFMLIKTFLKTIWCVQCHYEKSGGREILVFINTFIHGFKVTVKSLTRVLWEREGERESAADKEQTNLSATQQLR